MAALSMPLELPVLCCAAVSLQTSACGGQPADLDDISIPRMLDRLIIGPSP
jgi:hypothetical protein